MKNGKVDIILDLIPNKNHPCKYMYLKLIADYYSRYNLNMLLKYLLNMRDMKNGILSI
jgi:hypothetical protein